MAKTIAGFFHTPAAGEAAQAALLSGGFTRDTVSFVTGDTRGHEMPKLGPIEEVEGGNDLAEGAFLGSAIGLAVGIVAVFIPGIGPLIAAGPLAGAIAGLSVGAGAGGIIGLLMDHGVSKEEAEFYAEGVRRGGALITVQYVEDEERQRAQEIMKKHGAIETEKLTASPR